MPSVAEIAKPIDVLEVPSIFEEYESFPTILKRMDKTDHLLEPIRIVIWPWFDLKNIPNLNKLWKAYASTRRKCGIHQDWPWDRQERAGDSETPPLDAFKLIATSGDYVNFEPLMELKNERNINPEDPKWRDSFKPFAQAHEALLKGLAKHFNVWRWANIEHVKHEE